MYVSNYSNTCPQLRGAVGALVAAAATHPDHGNFDSLNQEGGVRPAVERRFIN